MCYAVVPCSVVPLLRGLGGLLGCAEQTSKLQAEFGSSEPCCRGGLGIGMPMLLLLLLLLLLFQLQENLRLCYCYELSYLLLWRIHSQLSGSAVYATEIWTC